MTRIILDGKEIDLDAEIKEYIEKHKHKVTPQVVEAVRGFIKEDGVNYFKTLYEEHGTVSPVLNAGGIPHSVHLNEGMQIRNFLRGTKYCKDWNDHDYDNLWAVIIDKLIGVRF